MWFYIITMRLFFDFCEDEYDIIFGILKNIVMSDFPISIKRGKHYGALCKV